MPALTLRPASLRLGAALHVSGVGRVLGLVALFALFGAGCSAPKFTYIIDATTTFPTEKDDKPGIWHDAERRTPARPLPKPIRGCMYRFFHLPADPGEGPKENFVYEIHSDTFGCATIFGRMEGVGPEDKFRLEVGRKGFRTLSRVLTREDVKNASMTVVMAQIPGAKLDEDAIGHTEGHRGVRPAGPPR